MSREVSAFLGKHGFVQNVDVDDVADAILYDMDQGLHGKKADQEMIRTWTLPPEKKPCNKSVIVIDAGGTNFRSCLVTFDAAGVPSISDLEKTRMPGVERELSKKEFFDQFAENLAHLKDKADCIGFCFSYPVEITPDGDGILIGFSKEVKAPEVVGCKIGQSLSDALVEHGWKKPKSVMLLNDTVAALLAGAANPASGNVYSSYVGFILGTGMNAAYIQPALKDVQGFEKADVINTEVGKFCSIPRSDFDRDFDATSAKPGTFYLEKSCSGAYLGPVSYYALKTAAKEGWLSDKFAAEFLKLPTLTLIELDGFLHAPYKTDNTIGGLLAKYGSKDDYNFVFEVLDAVVNRSARYAAAILVASVLKTEQGHDKTHPVCIVCNGTTFYKTYRTNGRIKACLEESLTKKRGLAWHAVQVENDITLGAAIGGLIRG
ncbi:MAG: hexokinase [Treponema sp.]|nr:hexokinase [Treponema sp.]